MCSRRRSIRIIPARVLDRICGARHMRMHLPRTRTGVNGSRQRLLIRSDGELATQTYCCAILAWLPKQNADVRQERTSAR
eukprot:4349245-Alexandrium_andersonii.AAC.1